MFTLVRKTSLILAAAGLLVGFAAEAQAQCSSGFGGSVFRSPSPSGSTGSPSGFASRSVVNQNQQLLALAAARQMQNQAMQLRLAEAQRQRDKIMSTRFARAEATRAKRAERIAALRSRGNSSNPKTASKPRTASDPMIAAGKTDRSAKSASTLVSLNQTDPFR